MPTRSDCWCFMTRQPCDSAGEATIDSTTKAANNAFQVMGVFFSGLEAGFVSDLTKPVCRCRMAVWTGTFPLNPLPLIKVVHDERRDCDRRAG